MNKNQSESKVIPMNYDKKLTELDKEIESMKRELPELLRKRREQKKAEINKGKKLMPRGRPRISEDILIQAVRMMATKTTSDVCLRLNISKTTLHRYGINRKLGGYRIDG